MRRAVLLALAAALVLAAPARGQSTITMSGSVVTRALVADLAYFYRHEVPDPPRFSLAGGVSATGIADAANRVVSAGMVARASSRRTRRASCSPRSRAAGCAS